MQIVKRYGLGSILILLLLAFIVLAPFPALADVNDFTVREFSADETLSRADPQGQLRIVEHIEVDFTDDNHGILRAIPKSYKGHPLKFRVNRISSDSGASAMYKIESNNGNAVLKIGNPDQTVTGRQKYTIDYTISNVITFYGDHDELYWDVNGDQWGQPFEHVQVMLHLPDGLELSKSGFNCYVGSYGSSGQTCATSVNGKTLVSQTSVPLDARQTLTYVVGFQKGYFTDYTWLDTVKDNMANILAFWSPIVLLGGGSVVYWWRYGRDSRGCGTIVPEYVPPQGIGPLAAGAIVDFKVDNRDITATLIDVARRGYVKIIETTQKKMLRKDKLSYTLELTNNDMSQLTENEKLLTTKLFPSLSMGSTTNLDLLKNKLYETANNMRGNVENELTQQGYFRKNPQHQDGRIMVAIFVAAMIAYASYSIFGIWLVLGLVMSIVIAIVCLLAMPARTTKGTAAREQLLGLKVYMETAEKDRLEKLEGPNAQYADQASQPIKTVELFEKLLPYAMVLGVEKQWARQFENIYTEPPSWYVGNWTSFNAGYLAGSLNDNFNASINQSFSASSSSSSSGLGGGGFSGGGGGGGGGGGW